MGFEPLFPVAEIIKPQLPTWGKFPDMPTGVTLHYTADDSLARSISALRHAGLGYHLLVDKYGIIHQGAPFTDRVYHAGKAMWLGNRPNATHLAVSLVSWGKLTGGKSWRGDEVPEHEIVERQGGQWHAASRAQEESIEIILEWMVDQGIDPRHICGHDECAIPPGRKIDPGGVLSVSTHEIREGFISRRASKAC